MVNYNVFEDAIETVELQAQSDSVWADVLRETWGPRNTPIEKRPFVVEASMGLPGLNLVDRRTA